ncbi:MAG: hypothetical protein ABSG05_02325 [Candidatus Pacearchaeota archaeon]|jgi:hypothetical protein
MIKARKGNILTENVIFIVLNLVFIAILLVFIFLKAGSAAVLEEKYAKQIALAIDSAEPGMVIHLNMQDALSTAKSNGIQPVAAVRIIGNVVTVKLRDNGGYSYSFFNNLNFDNGISKYHPDETSTGFVFIIGG